MLARVPQVGFRWAGEANIALAIEPIVSLGTLLRMVPKVSNLRVPFCAALGKHLPDLQCSCAAAGIGNRPCAYGAEGLQPAGTARAAFDCFVAVCRLLCSVPLPFAAAPSNRLA